LKESGALTSRNLERIRAANRVREKKYESAEKSPLIKELDDLVMNMNSGMWRTMHNDLELD
jgi:hypothetical protein